MRAVIWSSGSVVSGDDIRAALLPTQPQSPSPFDRPIAQGIDLEGILDDVKQHYIGLALQASHGNKTAAAKLLGLASHQTLANWMKRLGINADDPV